MSLCHSCIQQSYFQEETVFRSSPLSYSATSPERVLWACMVKDAILGCISSMVSSPGRWRKELEWWSQKIVYGEEKYRQSSKNTDFTTFFLEYLLFLLAFKLNSSWWFAFALILCLYCFPFHKKGFQHWQSSGSMKRGFSLRIAYQNKAFIYSIRLSCILFFKWLAEKQYISMKFSF